MSLKTTLDIDIVKVVSSKIDTVDFQNLTFGNVFTDHMLVCDYVDGKLEGELLHFHDNGTIDKRELYEAGVLKSK